MPVDKFGRMSDLKTKDTGVSLTYINNNYVRSDGETPLTGSLNMRGNTIYNVADPVNPQDVVTKVYVDNTKGSGVIGRKTKDGVSIKKNLDFLGKQKIKNLPDPVNDHDAVTKEYVDDKTKNLFIDKNDNIAFGLNVDMEGNKIFSLPEPEQDHEPATKKYVDDLQTQYIDKRGNVKFDRNINVGNNRIFAVKEPRKDNEATNKKYVDDSITKRLQEEKDNFLPQDPATKEYVDEAIKGLAGGDLLVSKEGVFIKLNGHYRATAPLDIDNHKMENLPDPVDDKDAVNKKYIDGIVENLTLKQGLIRENGGFNLVDSYINMNFNNIRNLGLPKDESDAVPRRFVDSMIKEVEEKINKRKHLIAVHARYCGPLIKGDYPFKFGGGNSFENCEEIIEGVHFLNKDDVKSTLSGFVIPHSGQLRKIICEGVTYIDLNKMINKLINSFNEEQINELKKYFGKEDFKKDLLEKIKSSVDFTTDKINERPLQKGKTFFEITSTSKSFSGDDKALIFFNKPAIFSTAIIEKVEWKEVELSSSVNVIRAIMKIIYFSEKGKWYSSFKEGDTLNIRISDFKKNFFGKGELIDNILKPIVIFLLGTLSFNFTFLIELDPL